MTEKTEIAKETRNSIFTMNVRRILAGILIGLGCILPGVSGGVMAVVFGLYRPMLDAVEGFFKNIKKNTLFLLPIVVGGGLGLLLGSFVIDFILKRFYAQVMFLFIGLVVGGIPAFVKEATCENGFKPQYLIAALVGAGIAGLMAFLDQGAPEPTGEVLTRLSIGQALIAGMILAIGTIVPGISTSFVFIYLGWYQSILAAVSALDIVMLVFIALGAVITAVLIIKAVRLMFNKMGGYAYYGILGFLCVSVVLIFPGIQHGMKLAINLALIVIGFFATYITGRSFQKNKNRR